MKAVTNSISTFLLMTMVMIMMQTVIMMEINERDAYSSAASAGRSGAIADNMAVAVKNAYSAAGFNIATQQPGLVQYNEAYPPPGISNLSANLNSLSVLFNATAGPDSISLLFQAAASQPSFKIAPLNATITYDTDNYTRITPINANYSSGLVRGYNVSIGAMCSNFSHDILNMSSYSPDKLMLRIDLRCSNASVFTMVYNVDKYNLTQIKLSEANATIVIVTISSPAKLEVLKGRQMQLNVTMSVAADPKLEVPSSYVLAAGNFSRQGAVVVE